MEKEKLSEEALYRCCMINIKNHYSTETKKHRHYDAGFVHGINEALEEIERALSIIDNGYSVEYDMTIGYIMSLGSVAGCKDVYEKKDWKHAYYEGYMDAINDVVQIFQLVQKQFG